MGEHIDDRPVGMASLGGVLISSFSFSAHKLANILKMYYFCISNRNIFEYFN